MTADATATPDQIRPLAEHDRFGRFIERRDGADFPFYNGVPVELSVAKWVLVWVSVAAGFLALIFIPQPNEFVAILPRALFVAIPLAVLAVVAGRHWTAIFRRVRLVDVGNMFFFAALNIALTFVIGAIVSLFFPMAANETIAAAGAAGPADTIALYVGSGIQLVGEEVFVVLPFLALMYFLFAKAGVSRKTAIILAWIISSLWFGAAHLPTYDWNWVQAIVVIGSARIALTLAFIRTKNLWVSAGAHIINDWVFITIAVIAAGAAASAAG
ncbi:CPBP family intramembrane glutamic endopeptidase [Agromyces badenianii]|uniref:CPBP family intramembrane glutamic endopeptidase n=1 Tax=Agromyces badenianii TaxID=2080742 RepID=UPI000D59753B|nr:CPBP family intramembrane glutamic endopeptidase [Agromyces badenianii]PWC03468.1 CPBP family intramembrane metalloprotease [Agromyces badenianii]